MAPKTRSISQATTTTTNTGRATATATAMRRIQVVRRLLLAALLLATAVMQMAFLPLLAVDVVVAAPAPTAAAAAGSSHHHRRVAAAARLHSSSSSSSSTSSSSSSLKAALRSRWRRAAALAALEQSVEDCNADWIAQSRSGGEAVKRRRLLVLPLDETLFDPPPGVFSHRHVQTGDKVSLPACFLQAIHRNRAEVPYLFELRRVVNDGDGGDGDDGGGVATGPRVELNITDDADGDTIITECQSHTPLDRCVAGPLDFRAPSNYVFAPWWVMRALGLRPLDVVEVEQTETVPPGSLVKLRPHSRQFARDVTHPQAVLETELRHYSALTQGATIAMDYNRKRYWFDVVELRSAPRGEKVPTVKMQDCDVATDFLPSREALREQKKKKKQQREQRQRQRQEQEL